MNFYIPGVIYFILFLLLSLTIEEAKLKRGNPIRGISPDRTCGKLDIMQGNPEGIWDGESKTVNKKGKSSRFIQFNCHF